MFLQNEALESEKGMKQKLLGSEECIGPANKDRPVSLLFATAAALVVGVKVKVVSVERVDRLQCR